MAHTSLAQSFVIFGGDRNSRVPSRLAEPEPQALGFLDQVGLEDNLGVRPLGCNAATFAPPA